MNFDSISHEDWLAKVKKELKKEDLSDLFVSLTPSIKMDPFFGRKPIKTSGNRLEKNWKHKQVYIASQFNNKLLLEDLVGGINTVEIIVDQENLPWKDLLKGVIFEYLDLSFLIESKVSKIEVEKELNEFNVDFKLLNKNHIFSIDSKDFIEQLKTTFKDIIELLDECNDKNSREKLFSSLRIDRTISSKMIAELGISESIEIISLNICKGFDMEPKCISMHATCNSTADTTERNYIDLSLKALTAGLGNYDAITIAPASLDKKSFHNRISRNIHLLLKEEAVLTQSRSAFKGAFQVKEISDRISNEIWSYIK